MYADPSQLRNITLKIRLNEIEDNLIDAICAYTGQSKSTLIRRLLLEQAALVLTGEANLPGSREATEGANRTTRVA